MRQMIQSMPQAKPMQYATGELRYAFRFDIPIHLISGVTHCKIEKIEVMMDTIILEGIMSPYHKQRQEQYPFQHQALHSSLNPGYPLLQTEDQQKRLQ